MPDTDFPKRLQAFHSRLSPDLQYDFRRILDDFAAYYFDVGEIFKITVIDLIPSKVARQDENGFYGKIEDDGKRIDPRSILPMFTPATKSKTGDPLAELAASLSPEQQATLRSKLEKK